LKIAKFSNPRVFNAPAEGVPLGIWYGRKGQKSLSDGATRWSKKFSDRFSRLDTIPAVADRQTDGHVAVAKTRLLLRAGKTVCDTRNQSLSLFMTNSPLWQPIPKIKL